MEFKPFKQGKYVLLERIASGGMAEVYRAKADGAGGFVKQLAVKRILPTYSQNDEFQKMFEYEARLSSQLTHANIVQIYDFIQSGDVYLLAMEFVDGKNLRQFINKAKKVILPIPIPFSVYVVNEAAKGLDYAHKKKDDLNGRPLNIIHRDMSPQNIMCSYEGSIKIVDFGIAKAKDRVDETRSGIIKGKFGYMSPEQANGESVDARSDVFSTVIILWEMLTGRRLFTADNDLATLKMIQECQITPPSKFNPNVKPELERIVMKGLTKDISLRYLDAGSLSRDLQNYLMRSYPTFSSKEISDVLQRAFKEEIEIEKKRWEEALRKSITFSQGADLNRDPETLAGHDGEATRSETGIESIATNGEEDPAAPVESSGRPARTLASQKEQTLMDFDVGGDLDPAMMPVESSASTTARKAQPRDPVEERTMISEDELVTPSPVGSFPTQPATHSIPKSLSGISATGSTTEKVSPKQGVSDPDIMLPGQQGGVSGSLTHYTEADLRVKAPESTASISIVGVPKPHEDKSRSDHVRPSPIPDSPNIFLDKETPVKRTSWSSYFAAASIIAFLCVGVFLYRQGGVPALIESLSERTPAKTLPHATGGGSFKAPTSTADDKAKNENQCIMKADSDPRGATVIVNKGTDKEDKKGITPTTFILPCGATKVVTVELAGYQTISDNVVITKRTDEKYWTLRRIPKGVVRLILSQNANVWVDGQFVKYLTAREPFEIELSARRGHRFEFKNTVLGIDQFKEIDIEPDTTREERVSLEEKVKR